MEKAIHWFPGHMAKTYRIIKEKISLVDVVIEVLDSRAPLSSLNRSIREVIGNKPLLLVLNKCDLADPKETEKYLKQLNKENYTIALDSLNGTKNINTISNAVEIVLKEKIIKSKEQGKSIYPIRAMVMGIPNVGKSTLLNNLAKRKALETGDRPGVTKNMQYLRANDKLLLLDNPGTLWPKFESENQAKLIALIGSIKDEILPLPTIASFGLEKIKELYPNLLKERYKLDSLDKSDEEIFLEIGKKRGAIIRGGEIDLDKTYDIFLRELRSGKIGAMTFERDN
ncbi:ribosome biogenesis GTPase YlqF [bacterium]|nr:ribosome biogenesis GTPase YlqF [bacterium]